MCPPRAPDVLSWLSFGEMLRAGGSSSECGIRGERSLSTLIPNGGVAWTTARAVENTLVLHCIDGATLINSDAVTGGHVEVVVTNVDSTPGDAVDDVVVTSGAVGEGTGLSENAGGAIAKVVFPPQLTTSSTGHPLMEKLVT